MTHEDFSRQEEIKPSSDRSFGLVIAAFFLIVALWPLIHAEPVRWWALGVAAVFAVLALLWTAALAPLNKLWMKLGLLLYTVVSPIVLGLLFYRDGHADCAVDARAGQGPAATAPRSRRRELLDRAGRRPGPPPESMKNQF